MGFFIRKSFRAGPVRLNLSKGGFGLSAGVKGARIGTGPRGSYVHAGRKGLYYRKSLKNGKRTKYAETFSDGSGCLTFVGIILGLFVVVYLVRWLLENPVVFFSAAGIGIIVAGTIAYRNLQRRLRINKLKRHYDDIFVRGTLPATAEQIEQLRDLKTRLLRNKKTKPSVERIERNIYEALLDQILDDGIITPDEKTLIEQLESVVTIDEDFKKETKQEIFRLAYLDAIADREIMREEIKTLENIIIGLGITPEEIKDELSVLREILRAQRLSLPLPPSPNVSIKLPGNETPYYASVARVLSRRKAGRGTDMEYEYSVRREGEFVITDRRVLVVAEGATAVKLSDVLDVDVDLDNRMIILSKSTSSQPVLLQTKEPLYAGRMIDLLTQKRP